MLKALVDRLSGRSLNMKNVIEPETDKELQKMIQSMMSAQEADWIASSAMDNPVFVTKLLAYSYSDDRKLSFRAFLDTLQGV